VLELLQGLSRQERALLREAANFTIVSTEELEVRRAAAAQGVCRRFAQDSAALRNGWFITEKQIEELRAENLAHRF
jgi:hypothetical protein